MIPVHFQRFVDKGLPKWIDGRGVVEFVERVLLDPDRRVPVVGIATRPVLGDCLVDAVQLAADLRGDALVVVIPHGHTSWVIKNHLGSGLDVHSGFARVWLPHLTASSSGDDHPLIPVYDLAGGRKAAELIQLAVLHRPWPPRRPSTPRNEVVARPQPRGPSGSPVPFDHRGPRSHELGWWSSRGA